MTEIKHLNSRTYLVTYCVVIACVFLKSTVVSGENIENITSTVVSVTTRSASESTIKTRSVSDSSTPPSISVGASASDTNTSNYDYGKIFNTTIHTLPQIHGFNTTEVSSGPIVLFDKKTVFIANFNFTGTNKDAHFWAGRGTSFEFGFVVPDENNVSTPLGDYNWQSNVLCVLQKNLTWDDIDYFGVWSNSSKTDYGHVVLSEIDKSGLREHDKTDEKGKKPFLLPKCCPLGTRRTVEGCPVSEDGSNIEITIYDSNQTHIDPNRTLDSTTLDIQAYIYPPRCEPGQDQIALFPLEEKYGLIYNMSLIVNGKAAKAIFPHGRFCIDQFENQTETTVFICVSPDSQQATMPGLYLPLLIISMICFAISAICYWFILRVRDAHRVCFVVYSTAMFITFFTLIVLQTTNNHMGCMTVGSIFVFATMVSFSWLAILSIDLIYIVKYFKENKTNDRMYWYIGVSFGVSFIVLLLSLFINPPSRPNIPNTFIKPYSDTHCEFEGSNISMFFAPIGVLVLIAFGSLLTSFHYIRTYDQEYRNEYDWLSNRNNYKFLWSQYALTLLIMFIPTFMEFMLSILDNRVKTFGGVTFALMLLESMQGIFILLVFFSNRYRQQIKDKDDQENASRRNVENGTELQLLHGEILLRSYMVIVIIAGFWLAEAIFNFYFMPKITKLAFDLIEASLGVVTIIIFVLNRYTRRELKRKLSCTKPKSKTRQLELELNGFPTPATPPSPAWEPQFPGVTNEEKTSLVDKSKRENNKSLERSEQDERTTLSAPTIGWVPGTNPNASQIGFVEKEKMERSNEETD